MSTVHPIPEGYPRLTPYLYVDGAGAAIDFYTDVLGGRPAGTACRCPTAGSATLSSPSGMP